LRSAILGMTIQLRLTSRLRSAILGMTIQPRLASCLSRRNAVHAFSSSLLDLFNERKLCQDDQHAAS
jgi:hypothetical protein